MNTDQEKFLETLKNGNANATTEEEILLEKFFYAGKIEGAEAEERRIEERNHKA